MSILPIIIGVILGVIVCRIWECMFWGVASLRKTKLTTCLKVLEHYHIGLYSLILSALLFEPISGVLLGLGLELIIEELLQHNPLAIGKDHFYTSSIIGGMLLIILLLVYLKMLL